MEYGERQQKRRFVVITAIFSGAMGVLTLYLFWLQIVKGGEFTQRARDVSERETPLTAQRGEIFDRQGDDPLVFNVDSFSVDISPGEVPPAQLPALFARLSRALAMPVADIEQKVPPKTWRQFQPIEVKGGVTLQSIAEIAERLEEFRGVSWHNKPIRSYVESGTLAHVVGYVGDITRDELQVLYNKSYAPGTTLGKSGIEKQYDDILRGRDGKRFRIVDVKEKGVTGAEDKIEPPTPGQNVVLTIDRSIQRLAEQALGPRNGSVVVLKPSTGEVLALVSYPSFDPNRFFGSDASTYFTKLTLDPSSPFIDRAIQSAYPPGSTFKVIMTTGIVDDGTIPITQAVLCTGKLEFGDRVFNCWQKTGHGYEDLFGGLAQSCDVYFWTMGNRLGPDKILAYARDFGVGSLTGIDLPGRSSRTAADARVEGQDQAPPVGGRGHTEHLHRPGRRDDDPAPARRHPRNGRQRGRGLSASPAPADDRPEDGPGHFRAEARGPPPVPGQQVEFRDGSAGIARRHNQGNCRTRHHDEGGGHRGEDRYGPGGGRRGDEVLAFVVRRIRSVRDDESR